VSKSSKVRIENRIADHGSYGIIINGGSGCVVVNCTVVDCSEMGVSLAATTKAIVFNNCIAGSSICLNIDKPSNVQSDNNLFFGLCVGQTSGQTTKRLLTGWQYVTAEDGKCGLDIHSVQMPVVFKDEGVKSAGVFTKDGMPVSYLFQNLPLPKGTYAFWLPVRSYAGQPIAAGDYEVRLVESDFKWNYLSHIGDTGPDCGFGPLTASANPNFVAFASKDTVVMLEGWSEGHTALRCFDVKTGEIRWSLPGSNTSQGLVVKDGIVYFLYASQGAGVSRLTRVNATTGAVMPWPGAVSGHMFPVTGPNSYSMAVLGDRLYVANAVGNKLTVLKTADGTTEKTPEIASPKAVAGDDKNNLLWVISGGSLVAMDATGKRVAQSNVVADPADVAACNGKLAVASYKTGKVHILDVGNPGAIKPVGELGKGDGPYGKIEPDRFFFQKAPGWFPAEVHRPRHTFRRIQSGRSWLGYANRLVARQGASPRRGV